MVPKWKYWTLAALCVAAVTASVGANRAMSQYNETMRLIEDDSANQIRSFFRDRNSQARFEIWNEKCERLYGAYEWAFDSIGREMVVQRMYSEFEEGEELHEEGVEGALFHLVKLYQHTEGVYDPNREVNIEEDIIQVEFNGIS